jgi:hypothetical protein
MLFMVYCTIPVLSGELLFGVLGVVLTTRLEATIPMLKPPFAHVSCVLFLS